MVRNECVRFGGHVHIEVRYKILYYTRPQFTLFSIWANLRPFCSKTPLVL
jgi:hypothetical protein